MLMRLCALTLAVGGLAAITSSDPPRAVPTAATAANPAAPTVPPYAAELPPGYLPPVIPFSVAPATMITPVGDLSAPTSHSEDPNAGPMVDPFAGRAQDAATLLGAVAPPGWQPPQPPAGEPAFPGQLPPWGTEDPGNGGGVDPAACTDCIAGSIFENEPLCSDGYIDATNGGCNSSPNVFGQMLQCGDSVCGTYGTYLSSTGAPFRDTDWYRVTVAVPTTMTWSAVGSASTRVFILSAACPTTTIATTFAGPCQPATVTANLAPGNYYLFVGTDAFTGVPCGSRYRASLTGTPCCVTGAQPGDIAENEPSCGTAYIDATNGGCNSSPNVFGSIACGQTVAGTYGTFLSSTGTQMRDTDWYTFTLTQTSNVTWTCTGEAPTTLFIFNSLCPTTSLGTISGNACTPLTLTVNNLAPGTYRAWVGTSVFTGVPCGSHYRATLTTTTCCQTVPQPGDLAENEPSCGNAYIDATNGGCNSSPNVFGSIACGQTVAGTYGTFLSSTGVNNRDTDWYTFTLTQTSNVTWTCTGEAPTTLFIFNNICPTTSLGTISGNACTPITLTVNNLAPGTYRAWVGTSVFTGVPCTSRYRATLTTTTCCTVPPLAGDAREGEENCYPARIDTFNGGCNSPLPIFSRITCNQVVAGTYGTFLNGATQTRDTDWYTFTIRQRGNVRWAAIGEAPTQLAITSDTCPATVISSTNFAACAVGEINIVLNPGVYRAFIATNDFTGVLCPARYRCVLQSSVCGCPADYNGDTVLDFFDYLDFVSDFAANAPLSDYNGDTVIDLFDYLDFVAAFAAGC